MGFFNTDNNILKRAFLFLEDGDWEKADEYFEKALDEDATCGEAYFGKMLVTLRIKKAEDLKYCKADITKNKYYEKIMRFGNVNIRTSLAEITKTAAENAEIARKNTIIANFERIFKESSHWNIEDFDKALTLLESIKGYKNVDQLIELCISEKEKCLQRIEFAKKELEEYEENKRIKKEAIKKALKKYVIILSLLGIASYFTVTKLVMPAVNYNEAVELMEAGMYEEAITIFTELGDYKDSAEKVKEASCEYVGKLYDDGECAKALGLYMQMYGYKDAAEKLNKYYNTNTVSARGYTVGLKANGTVVAVGYNDYGQCDVSDWKDIVAVSSGIYHTVGLKADGTVVAVGYNGNGRCDVSGWKDIVAVSAGDYHTVGLKADGTVVAVGYNNYSQCDVSGWTDIVAVSAGSDHTVGLKSDGTVVAVGHNEYGRCNVSGWTDIVAVSAGDEHTVGLKADGTVVAVGYNGNGRCDVSEWEDIVAVSAGIRHTVGLKADGTVVAVGDNRNGRCDVSGWKNIKMPNIK